MDAEHFIPHLKMAGEVQLYRLEKKLLEAQLEIEGWLREAFINEAPLLTTSVDIRNAGFKLSPVDTNLFPAGFNNLNPEFYPLCIQAFQNTMAKLHPTCQRILLIPENHTRNSFYLESLYVLYEIAQKSGYEVRIGTFAEIVKPKEMPVSDDRKLTYYPLVRFQNQLHVEDFCPDIILLNNDLSDGVPEILKNIEQIISPISELGWTHRYKSQHFKYYQSIAQAFSNFIEIDPWEISPIFEDCGEIDFMSGDGENCLLDKTKKVLDKIKLKYQQYDIKEKPFVVVKADQGTYGMAVMMIEDPNEITTLNRKQRQNMGKRKGGKSVRGVIIQEGVHTFETIGESIAEPVVYMIGQNVVGGFYRVHTKKGPRENLNAPGMHFEPLAFETCCNNPDLHLSPHAEPNRFYVYSVIARLALLATCQEQNAIIGTR